MREKILNKNGITLIALVITIIVLLILAGVAIATLTGENGLFARVKQAKIQTAYTNAKEILNLKLMDINAECISKGKVCTIENIYEGISKDSDINIVMYYTSKVSKVKDGIERDVNKINNLSEIVVQVNKYEEYSFLIDKDAEINGVMNSNSDEIDIGKFLTIQEFEKKIFGKEITNDSDNKVIVDESILDDVQKFQSTLNDEKKLEYVISNNEIFMNKILSNEELAKRLFSNENAMDMIIKNTTWRNAILESNNDKSGENSLIIKALDESNCITLPTSNLGLYDSSTKQGNVLYSGYLRNDSIHSPINAFLGSRPGRSDWETPTDGLPAYIGFDFGEDNPVWVYKAYVMGGNNTTPTKMFLQASDDNLEWNTIYEFTRYTTVNDYITEVINSSNNNSRHRYWRLYITESSGGNYVDLLKWNLYAK